MPLNLTFKFSEESLEELLLEAVSLSEICGNCKDFLSFDSKKTLCTRPGLAVDPGVEPCFRELGTLT